MASGSAQGFDNFYKELKQVEAQDSNLTSKQQIDRLLKPGYTYRNLNPFEVLQVDPDLKTDDVKKKFRKLSILVHPDKNANDQDRAQVAFDAVKRAWNTLEDQGTKNAAMEIVEEARGRTKINMEEKRRRNKKDGRPLYVEEDDPIKFKLAVSILTMKLFADQERKRQMSEDKISEDAKRKREKELEDEEKKSKIQEFEKNWEETRQGRVDSWHVFRKVNTKTNPEDAYDGPGHEGGGKEKKKKKEKKEKKFSPIGFRPPKTKPESRL